MAGDSSRRATPRLRRAVILVWRKAEQPSYMGGVRECTMAIRRGTIHDFHSHTYLSDGELSPVELIRRAAVAGYATLAITDHCGIGDLRRILATLRADRDA